MSSRRTSGMAVAAAAAVLFSTLAATAVRAAEATIKCTGVNACKGQSACKSLKNSCKRMNSYKGQGFLEMTKAQCDAAKAKGKSSTPAMPDMPGMRGK
jgi:hypothetical protein